MYIFFSWISIQCTLYVMITNLYEPLHYPMSSINKQSKLTWLTLIEIMIAMFVFGVGILSILTMITQNISLIDRVKTQTNASIYAKEWIELIYQIRNTNILLARKRNCAISNPDAETEQELCQHFFLSGEDTSQWLLVWFDPQNNIQTNTINLSGLSRTGIRSQAQLYKHTWILASEPLISGTRINHDITNGMTIGYARVISFEPVILNSWWDTLPINTIVKVSSKVYTTIWSKTGIFMLQSFIWNR